MTNLSYFSQLNPQVKITDIPLNQKFLADLSSENCLWFQEILKALNETQKAEGLEDGSWSEEVFLKANFTLERKHHQEFNDHILLEGQFETCYYMPCIKCLAPSKQEGIFEFKAIFLPESMAKLPDYADIDCLFLNEAEYEIYFQEKKRMSLSNFFAEQLNLTNPPYPLHTEECKGLCLTCGADLNYETCPHCLES